mmetsp:Transcript_17649/g.33506  ORF Transcript_17649/g.33506 Transcript_17649/m.33506 type:complete len:138 (-) Transcript_17649:415-828(-)
MVVLSFFFPVTLLLLSLLSFRLVWCFSFHPGNTNAEKGSDAEPVLYLSVLYYNELVLPSLTFFYWPFFFYFFLLARRRTRRKKKKKKDVKNGLFSSASHPAPLYHAYGLTSMQKLYLSAIIFLVDVMARLNKYIINK